MKNLFKQLYKSEINLSFCWFWDAGFSVKIGDDMNGFTPEFNTHDLNECEKWIEAKAKELYPNSKFAKEYKGETFESAATLMIKWLSENEHPHTMAEIDSTKAILWEGKIVHHDDSFIVD